MEKLRKVIFWKQLKNGFIPDLSEKDDKEIEENTREREGYFHCWTPALKHSPELNKEIPCMMAIIEEADTSELYEFPIENFRFVYPVQYVER